MESANSNEVKGGSDREESVLQDDKSQVLILGGNNRNTSFLNTEQDMLQIERVDEQHELKKQKSKYKSPNANLQPIQRRRKRSREKKRREGISAAMKELHDILAKINIDESRRAQNITANIQEDVSFPTREYTSNIIHSATLASSMVGGYQQLGQREIIVDAVHALTILHAENQRHKDEITQLTASLLSLQQTNNTDEMPTVDDNFNPNSFAVLDSNGTQAFPLYDVANEPLIMKQRFDVHMKQTDPSSSTVIAQVSQPRLDTTFDRTDVSSSDLIEALCHVDSFEKGDKNQAL